MTGACRKRYSNSRKSPDCFALGKLPATKQKVKRDVTRTKTVFCQTIPQRERDETTVSFQYLNKVIGHMVWVLVLWLWHMYKKLQQSSQHCSITQHACSVTLRSEHNQVPLKGRKDMRASHHCSQYIFK